MTLCAVLTAAARGSVVEDSSTGQRVRSVSVTSSLAVMAEHTKLSQDLRHAARVTHVPIPYSALVMDLVPDAKPYITRVLICFSIRTVS